MTTGSTPASSAGRNEGVIPASGASHCKHLYERSRRLGRWPRPKWGWRCVHCGFETRHYDSVDRMAGRPIHEHMSVAYKGVNTR